MIAAAGILAAGLLYLLSLMILTRTAGFKKLPGKTGILHFKDHSIPLEQGVIGLFQLFIGVILVSLWFYFLFIGWDSFLANFRYLLPHVLLQLLTGLSMLVSGFAAIREWKQWQIIYVVSFVFIIYGTLVSIGYGPAAHGRILTMAFIGVWSFCVAGIMTFSFYRLYWTMHQGKQSSTPSN